jgi:hypothetical protein
MEGRYMMIPQPRNEKNYRLFAILIIAILAFFCVLGCSAQPHNSEPTNESATSTPAPNQTPDALGIQSLIILLCVCLIVKYNKFK